VSHYDTVASEVVLRDDLFGIDAGWDKAATLK